MKRRAFITLLGGAAAWPLPTRAQQTDRIRRIGVLMAYAESDREGQALVAGFRDGLQKLGWAEGRNLLIDYRWATPNVELMQRFAKELVGLQPDLVLTQNTPTTASLLQHTRSIPIIFATASDPIGSGFVASLPQPGGNVTGFIDMEASISGKWLELAFSSPAARGRGHRVRRRDFIAAASAAAAWPLGARAQQRERLRRVGVIMSLPESDPEAQHRLNVLRTELQTRGWTDSEIRIDVRWPVGRPAELSSVAKELVELPADVIVAQSSTAVAAVQRETRAIPIVFFQVVDPVGQGLVTSLARPGGNVTGFSNFETGIGGKWVELLKEIAPHLRSVAVLFNPDTAPYVKLFLQSVEAAAPSFSVTMSANPVRDAAELETALKLLGDRRAAGVIMPPDIFTTNHRKNIGSMGLQYGLPTMAALPYMARDGSLMSYGPEVTAMVRRAVGYVDRILKGESPANLPIQQPTTFEFVINLKAAKALGIDVPLKLRAFASEVIE